MSKLKELIMVIMIVFVSCLLITTSFEVKAVSDNPIDISGNLDISLDENDTGTTQPDNNVTNTTENSQIIQPDTNTTANVTNTLPQTGVTEDITVMFFIVVCAVSAIYAYKKIRDYNI